MFSSALHSLLQFLSAGVSGLSGWQIFFYTLLATHVTIASVTIYLHRHQAHRALELHAMVSHFFRFWLWLTTAQITKEWAAVHRKHHAKCDTAEDPHSPVTRGIAKVLFDGAGLYRIESKNPDTIARYGHGTPDDWIERNLYSRFSFAGVGILLIVNVILFGALGIVVWAVQMMWIPITAAGIVNGVGHYWGYRNYDCADASTNIVPFGILIGGEELHNNHHTFASSARLSSKWFEIDIGWCYIRCLETLGLARVKKLPPVPKFSLGKAQADFDTLQAVIANRYDVMATYAASFKRAWKEEVAILKGRPELETGFLKSSRKLLQSEPDELAEPQRRQLSQLFEYSEALETMHAMRAELHVIWARSHFTRDQLLHKLQDWCARAEASGIKSLEEFSLRLRSYA